MATLNGYTVRVKREELQMTQETLAQRLGVDPSIIWDLEMFNANTVDDDFAEALTNTLGANLAYFRPTIVLDIYPRMV